MASWRHACWSSHFCISAGSTPCDLHDQRVGKREHRATHAHQNRAHYLNDEAATKLIYLTLRNLAAKRKMRLVFWKAALNLLVISLAVQVSFRMKPTFQNQIPSSETWHKALTSWKTIFPGTVMFPIHSTGFSYLAERRI